MENIPENIPVKIQTQEQLLQEYINSLNEKEYKAYMIAKEHLGSSFDLSKSNGFLRWKNKT